MKKKWKIVLVVISSLVILAGIIVPLMPYILGWNPAYGTPAIEFPFELFTIFNNIRYLDKTSFDQILEELLDYCVIADSNGDAPTGPSFVQVHENGSLLCAPTIGIKNTPHSTWSTLLYPQRGGAITTVHPTDAHEGGTTEYGNQDQINV